MVEFSDYALELEATLYTRTQQNILILTPCVTGPISFLSSCTIVFIILYDRKNKLQFQYQRMILAMSLMDAIGSIALSLGGVMTPRALGRLNSHGNIATCEAQGFLAQFNTAAALCNLFLCIFYHLVIVNQWKSSKLKKYHVESIMHTCAFLFLIISGSVGLAFDAFNPMLTIPAWCYYSEIPWDCNRLNEPCLRGKNYFYVLLGCASVPAAISVVGVIYCVVRIWILVRRQERLMERRYSIANLEVRSTDGRSVDGRSVDGRSVEGHSTDLRSAESASVSFETMPTIPSFRRLRRSSSLFSQHKKSDRTRQAAVQALLYTLAFLFTYTVAITQTFTAFFFETNASNRTPFFATSLLVVILTPLQGLWNLLIYVRPIYRRVQKQHPEYTIWSRLRSVLFGQQWQNHVKPSSASEPRSLQSPPQRAIDEGDEDVPSHISTLPEPTREEIPDEMNQNKLHESNSELRAHEA